MPAIGFQFLDNGPTLTQVTRVAARAVEVPGLPGDLDAYPVYRLQVRDGIEHNPKLLHLEVRAANTRRASAWRDTLASLDRAPRQWLAKNSPGKAKRITQRFGEQTLELLYQWCATGIVVFDVEPPPQPGATHGPLIGWRLTAVVHAHVEEMARRSEDQRSALAQEAKDLATKLEALPNTQLLCRILAEPHDPTFLEHAITVARTLVGDQLLRPAARDHGSINGQASGAYFILRQLGRGSFKDYLPDQDAIARGGQAVVYGATHKGTQLRVALKRVRMRDEDSTARMGREIEAGRFFGTHPNIMPVLDADPESRWFVMPVASGTARTYAQELQAPEELRRMLTAACEALRVPHEKGWVHRDLKPENLLLLDNQWTVADWGLGRRPRGETSNPGRTRTGTGYGTEGFAAPELSLDAHQAGPPADIYSLGQIIGVILTGRPAQANIPLIPPSGPWKSLVERATRPDPSTRPQSVDDLLDLLDSVR